MQTYDVQTAWWSARHTNQSPTDQPDIALNQTGDFEPIQEDFSPVKGSEKVEPSAWDFLTQMAQKWEAVGKYELTESLWLNALKIASGFRVDDPRCLATVSKLADFYFRNGNITNAKKWFVAEAQLTHELYGGEHERAADSLSRLGTVYTLDKSYPAARRCFSRALEIHSKRSGGSSWPAREAAYNLTMVSEIASLS